MGVTERLRQWIERALQHVQFGEVILVIHEGRVVRIDTKAREQIKER